MGSSGVHSAKPALPDGRDAVVSFLEGLLERYPDRIFTIHRVIASDDLVAVHYHSQATPEDIGFCRRRYI